MKTRDLRSQLKSMTVDELRARRVEVAEDLLRRRFRAAVGQGASGDSAGASKKQLARVETELRLRQVPGRD